MEVLEYKPKFEFAGIYAPIGFDDEPGRPYRPCDVEAREMVGWPRVVGVNPMPSRAALQARTRDEALRARAVADQRRLPPVQVAGARPSASSSRSTSGRSSRPTLTFVPRINGDQPLKTSPFHQDGGLERMQLIRDKLPGVEEVITRAPPTGAGSRT